MATLEDERVGQVFWLLGLTLTFRFFLSDLVLQVSDVRLFREPDSDACLTDLRFIQLILQNCDDSQLELVDCALTREVDVVVAVEVRPSLTVKLLRVFDGTAGVLAEAEHLWVCAYEEHRKLYRGHSHT